MAAPTTELTNGAGTITATGESNGYLIPIGSKIANPRLLIGFSDTFTSAVVAIRGRIRGLTNYFPLTAVRRATSTPVANSASISLTDSTAEAIEVDVSGCDYAEVYGVSGTLTALDVEARVAPANPNAQPLVLVNSASANTVTSTSASALTVGANGATNPVLQVDANTASVATGVKITGAAAGSRVAVAVISSGTNEGLDIDAKGSGTIRLGNSSTGNIVASRAIAGAAAITSSSATGGIGYATGAGGAVTQASSRTTGVTVNTVTGAITLVSAAGSTTPATFTVTNSAVAATDTVILSQKSGTDLYDLSVSAVAAGSFNITFNTKSGTTTEQPVFNFAVIKGVAS